MKSFVLETVDDIEHVAIRGFEILVDSYNKLDKEECISTWNRLYNLYFRLLQKSTNIGFLEARLLAPETYECLRESITGTPYYNDGFDESKKEENRERWEAFKADILERGSFFIFFIFFRNGNTTIFEGKHRLAAILDLIDEGKLPKNYKILCALYDEKSVLANKIAIQLGHVEKVLREDHNVIMQPKEEFQTPGFFGYMYNLPRDIKVRHEGILNDNAKPI